MPRSWDVSETLGMDIIVIYDINETKYHALSLVDEGTTYRVVALLEDTKAPKVRDAMIAPLGPLGWAAGAPALRH